MDSILNWIGGKSKSVKTLIELIPEHNCYVEVFAGALWLFFGKNPSKVEAVNDINGELINFYRILQRNPDKYLEREKYEMYSRELYYEYLQDFYAGKHSELSDVERAFRFFCLIKEAYASKFSGGWGYGAVRNDAKSFFNEFKIVDKVSKRLKDVQIDNRDFEAVIKGYDNETTLFYTDPPYSASANDDYYYKSVDSSFGMYDHQRLFNALKNMKGKFILTYDNTPWVRERYCTGDYFVIENDVFYSSADKDNRRTETELVIMNFDYTKIVKHDDINQGKLDF